MSDEGGETRGFGDLVARPAGGCRACGEPPAAVLTLSLRKLTGTNANPSIAGAKWRYCERHAVEAFEKILKAFPGAL